MKRLSLLLATVLVLLPLMTACDEQTPTDPTPSDDTIVITTGKSTPDKTGATTTTTTTAVASDGYITLAVDGQGTQADGEKVFVSDNTLTFSYTGEMTWREFAALNAASGFSIDKDFYGTTDLVYYTDQNGTKWHVVKALQAREVKPDDLLMNADGAEGWDGKYAAIAPHRESYQRQWLYDMVEEPDLGDGGVWRKATQLLLDPHTMTYTLSVLHTKKISANTYQNAEDVLAEGSYTSNDGDNLGSVLTLDNGYILTTTRSDTWTAQLQTGEETLTVHADWIDDFYA